MRWLALLLLIATPAWATSSINPNEPTGTAYSSAPIRENFGAFSSDVNALQNCNRGTAPPANPQIGYCWLNVTNPTTWCYEVYSGGEWTPVYAIFPTTNIVSLPIVPGCQGFIDALGLNTGAPFTAVGLNAGGALGLNH
jgi:hypothetical protein